jgi:hypothetical protein
MVVRQVCVGSGLVAVLLMAGCCHPSSCKRPVAPAAVVNAAPVPCAPGGEPTAPLAPVPNQSFGAPPPYVPGPGR